MNYRIKFLTCFMFFFALSFNKVNGETNMSNEVQKSKVIIKTNQGNITAELYSDKAPITVENFLNYVQNKHYQDTIFHRVIDGFMIQGGGFTVDSKQKNTQEPIQIEADNGLKNLRGTLAGCYGSYKRPQ